VLRHDKQQSSQSSSNSSVSTAAAEYTCKKSRERKHYFYADSPLGYQVTQQRWPLAKEGRWTCHKQQIGKKKKKNKKASTKNDDDDDDTFSIRIERIQLEQDTGKTTITTTTNTNTNGQTTKESSLVDFNRSGCALMEVVFYPDLRSASDAATAVETNHLSGGLQPIRLCLDGSCLLSRLAIG
jgi:aspartyl-tRNA(Asn)/glutamyl-tRNA(Gln) amidotransferase subunit B